MSSTNAFNTQQDTTATGKQQPGYLEQAYNFASNIAGSATNSASAGYNSASNPTDNTTNYRNQQPHVGGVGDLGTKGDSDVSRLSDERANPSPYTSGGTAESLENPNISNPTNIQQRLNARDPPNPYPEGNAGVGHTGDNQFRNQQDHVGGVGDLGTRSGADVVRLPEERTNPNPLSSNTGSTTNPLRETAAGTTGFGSTNRDTFGRDNNNTGFDSSNNFDSTSRNRDHHTTSNTAETVGVGAAAAGATAAGFNAERDHHNRDRFDNTSSNNTGFGSSNRDNLDRDNTASNTFGSSNRDNLDRDRTSNTGFGSSNNRDTLDRDRTSGNTGFDSTNRNTLDRDNNSGLNRDNNNSGFDHHRDHHKSSNTADTVAAGAAAAGATAAGYNAERDHHNRDKFDRDNAGADSTSSSQHWKPEQKSWDTGNVAGTMHDPTQHGHSGGVTGSNVDTDHGLGGPHRFGSERGNRDETALAGAGATDFQSGREGAYNADSRDQGMTDRTQAPLGDNNDRQHFDTTDRDRHGLDRNREGAYNEDDDATATSPTAKPGGPGKLDKLHGKIMVAKGKLTKDEEAIAQGKRLQAEGVAVHPNDFAEERRE